MGYQENEIKENKSNQNTPNIPHRPEMNQQTLDQMTNYMSTPYGRQLMKTMYKDKFGMEIDDAQIDMMSSMMTPDMMKMGMNMQQDGMIPKDFMTNTNTNP